MSEKSVGDRILAVLLVIAKVFQYVFAMLLVALIAAWLGSLGDVLLLFFKIELPGGWAVRHLMWIGGALLAAIGYPLGWIEINGRKFELFDKKNKKSQKPEEPKADDELQDEGTPSKILPSALFFGFVGALLGLMLGGSLLLIWFSLAMSPWPPGEWLESLSARAPDPSAPPGSLDREGGLTTSHPAAIYCMLGPIVLLGILGVLVGGVGAAFGLVKDPPRES